MGVIASTRTVLAAAGVGLWQVLALAQAPTPPVPAETSASATPAFASASAASSPRPTALPNVPEPNQASSVHPASDELDAERAKCFKEKGFKDWDFGLPPVSHFGDSAALSFPKNVVDSLSGVEVWVNRQMQLRWQGLELRSFRAEGAMVPVRMVIRQLTGVPPTPGTVALSEHGQPLLQLPPASTNRVDVFIHGITAGQVVCGTNEFSTETRAVETFAVVIGFNYTNTRPEYELKYAQNDAEQVAVHLIDKVGLKPENIWLVTDDPKAETNTARPIHFSTETTNVGVSSLIDQIKKRADPQSKLYVYYSGHMLVADDGKRQYDSYFFFPSSDPEIAATQLERNEFLLKIDQVPMSSTVVILDACYSGGPSVPQVVFQNDINLRSRAWQPAPPPSSTEPLPQMGVNSGQARLTLVSSKGTESWELEDYHHGVFTHFLLEAAEKPAHLTLADAFDHALNQMLVLKPKGWGVKQFSQEPDILDEHRGGKMDWRLQ